MSHMSRRKDVEARLMETMQNKWMGSLVSERENKTLAGTIPSCELIISTKFGQILW
jgi:hypothetical protein